MDTALYLGLTQQKALRRQMDVVANNIANMSTTAYKKERVQFKEFMMDAPGAQATVGGKISYIMDFGVERSMKEGPMINTGNPFDIFISGEGFLSVESKTGETVYTRNGRMRLDEERNLVTLDGLKILDNNGQTIRIDEQVTDITINRTGVINSELGQLGELGIFTFDNVGAMKRIGGSVYRTDEDPQAFDFEEGGIIQRAIEGSNVNAIESMVEMTKIMRAYQSAQRNMDGMQDMRGDSLDRLSRIQ